MNLAKAISLTKLALHTSALLLLLTAHGYATRRERVIDSWRPTNFNVDIRLDDRLSEITRARTEITVEVLKEKLALVDLDFGELPVDGVWIDGQVAQFDRAPGLLNIHLQNAASKGRRFVVSVEYHGKPKDGLILTNDKDGKPSATGDNWPDRVHHWIPCFDHPSAKATVKFTVTAPERDLVVANGQLNNAKADSPNTATWTYVENVPIPAYCMVIAVGEYAKSGPTTFAVTPLTYYVPQSDANRSVKGFAAAAPSLKFFSETIAPYPYEKLALIVGATRFGGMENSSAIVFAGNLLGQRSGPRPLSVAFNIDVALEQVVAHEIAHQWFGDSVTETSWADLWLSEGFATYFAGLVIEKYDGAAAFHAYMEKAAAAYLQYAQKTRTPIHDTETEKLFDLLNPNNYQKGAWVLHMLRRQLGDDSFFRGLKIYYNAHKNSTADSADLRAALEQASGKDLKSFFARWVYGSGHPQYELLWGTAEYAGAGGSVMITLKQTQTGEAFLNPVPIELISAGAKRRTYIYPSGKVTTANFRFSASEVPTAVRVDPDDTILKEVVVATK
jgi:aminopeptidase N